MTKPRTLAIALATTVASFALAKDAAQAALGHQLSRVGNALQTLAPDTPGHADLLTVNGARFEVSTQMSPRAPEEEVARFLKDCDADSNDGHGMAFTWPEGHTTLSVCLAPLSTADHEKLPAKLASAADSGDLSDLGELRMLRAMSSAEGSALVYLRGLGSISLRDMLPQEGDAAGVDLPGLPRPVGGRRLLSALSDSRQQGVAVYQVTGDEVEVRDAYRTSLREARLQVETGDPHLQVTSSRGDAYAVGFSHSDGCTQVAVVAMDLLR